MDIVHYLTLGEVHADRIGCFLLWVRDGRDMNVCYHSLVTTQAQLLGDCRELLENLLEGKREVIGVGPPPIDMPGVPKEIQDAMKKKFLLAIKEAIWTIEIVVTQVAALVTRHFREGLIEPWFQARSFEAYVGRGERFRQKLRGELIE